MRPLYTRALVALAALGLPMAAEAQLAPQTAPAKASLTACNWQPVGAFPGLLPRALAVAPDGVLLLAADDTTAPNGSVAVILRLPAGGGPWEPVDRYLPAGSRATGVRALHVDADGNAFLLAWVQGSASSQLVLRRSFGSGTADTWEDAEARWVLSPGGALTSAPDGRLYVAYGYAGPGGVGWRVESALRGMGAFALEDDFAVTGFGAAIPQDLERAPDGTLLVAGQLDGSPADDWVLRGTQSARNGSSAWRTLDRFKLTPNSYGMTPRAVVAARNGRVLVAGGGVRGGGSDDYQWLERWQNGRGRWKTSAFQLAPGLTSLALDATTTRAGIAELGIGFTPSGVMLLLRESTDGGNRWQTVLQVAGITDLWSARLAVGDQGAAVTASVQGGAAVIACR